MRRRRLAIVKFFSIIYRINENVEKYHIIVTIISGIASLVYLMSTWEKIHNLVNDNSHSVVTFVIELLVSILHFFIFIIACFLFLKGVAEPLFRKISSIKAMWPAMVKNASIRINEDDWQLNESIYSRMDIENLANYSIMAYGTEYRNFDQRVSLFSEWYNSRKECFSFLYNEKNEKVGYVCVLPLKSDKHYKGDKAANKTKEAYSQFNIEKNEIALGFAPYVMIQGLYIDENYLEDIEVLGQLLFKVLVKIALFSDKKKTIIYAEPFFASGEVLCNLIGLYNINPRKRSYEGHPYYEMTLKPGILPDAIKNNATLTIELINEIKHRLPKKISQLDLKDNVL